MINNNLVNMNTRLYTLNDVNKNMIKQYANQINEIITILRNYNYDGLPIARFLMGLAKLEDFTLGNATNIKLRNNNLIVENIGCFSVEHRVNSDVATIIKNNILKSGIWFRSCSENHEKSLAKLNELSDFLQPNYFPKTPSNIRLSNLSNEKQAIFTSNFSELINIIKTLKNNEISSRQIVDFLMANTDLENLGLLDELQVEIISIAKNLITGNVGRHYIIGFMATILKKDIFKSNDWIGNEVERDNRINDSLNGLVEYSSSGFTKEIRLDESFSSFDLPHLNISARNFNVDIIPKKNISKMDTRISKISDNNNSSSQSRDSLL